MELVFVIVIGILVSVFKKAGEQEQLRKAYQEPKVQNPWEQTIKQMPKQTVRKTPAREQIRQQNTTILQRAKANAEEDKIDVTLQTMETEHNHSERVAPAKHHHPEDVIPENLLGTVEDLMVKGYDGNLCFERDFIGEALDMISRFTVPSEVPDFTTEDVV